MLNFPHIVQIKADFNYSLESRFVHGEYNNNGTNKDLLNHPSDIFLGNTNLIISDTDNNRIVVLNRTNWDLLNIIYPYSKDINNNLVNVSSIYQTVETNDGTFYSLCNNLSIIEFKNDGLIFNKIDLPQIKYVNLPEYYSIGIDNSNFHSQLRVLKNSI